MTNAPKFTFDDSFDHLASDGSLLPELVKTVFNRDDIDQSFEQGKTQGINQTVEKLNAEIASQTAAALEKIVQELTLITTHEQEVRNTIIDQSCGLSYMMAKKILPHFLQKHELTEIELFIQKTLQEHLKDPKICVELHPKTRAEILKKEIVFPECLVFQDNAELETSDCRILWSEGSAERNLAAIWQEIENLFEIEKPEVKEEENV